MKAAVSNLCPAQPECLPIPARKQNLEQIDEEYLVVQAIFGMY
jgi:hypothetical protein